MLRIFRRASHRVALLSAAEASSVAAGAARSLIVRIPDAPKAGTVRLLDIFLVRSAAGWTCYENHCPHAGGPLNMLPDRYHTRDGEHLLCTRHGAKFSPDSGLCVHGPCAGEHLNAMRVELDPDGAVYTTVNELRELCDNGGGAYIVRDAESEEASGPPVQRPQPPEPTPSVLRRRQQRAAQAAASGPSER